MAKDKEPAERGIKFKVRPSIVSNVVISPEKHGKEFVEKHDVIFEQLLEKAEVGQFFEPIDGVDAIEFFWTDEGLLRYAELGHLPIDLKALGIVKLGYVKGSAIEFTGTLKKLSIEIKDDYRATLYGQVRVDPGNHHKMLAQLKVEHACKLGFDGAVDEKHEPGDDDSQAELPV
ncbi:MAG TPA: hypothetical protein VE907_06370 [Gammaproteobacteria bacterium]|nr:hypothetical protein [Gammaproteobacteria bacterium]